MLYGSLWVAFGAIELLPNACPACTLFITYGGKSKLRTPGVGSVLPWVVVVGTGRIGDADKAELCEADADAAEEASVALVMLKPSG